MHYKCKLVFVILFTAIPSCFPLHIGHNLVERKQRHKLSEDHRQCEYGVYQTPIHIEHHHVEPIIMPALEFHSYHNYLLPPLTMLNNGHTVKVKMGNYSENGVYVAPQISGALLSSSYTLESFHFHWGKVNGQGSEHVVNNVRYPLEMHLVHKNVQYYSVKEALNRRDGLVVLAFLFHLRVNDNHKLTPIIKNLGSVSEVNGMVELNTTFSLATILPRQLDSFFTYEGSLTTPPCSEAVTWFLFPETIPISFGQMEMFRSLPIEDNFRVLQPVGQRRIYLRKNKRFSLSNFKNFDRKNISSRAFWLHL